MTTTSDQLWYLVQHMCSDSVEFQLDPNDDCSVLDLPVGGEADVPNVGDDELHVDVLLVGGGPPLVALKSKV